MTCKTNDGLEIYYELLHPDAKGLPVVFLNGLTQSTAAWGFVVPHFKDHPVVLLDFIFQGKSDKRGDWRNFDQHAQDVKSVLDAAGIGNAHIAGLSYGSLVAQHFALNHRAQTSSLVLLSTFAHKTAYYEAVELGWWRALEKGGYNLMLDIMLPSVLSEGYFSNPVIPLNVLKEGRKELNQSSEAIFNLMRATKERGDFRPALRGISSKTLIIQGEKDLLLPVSLAVEVKMNIPDARLEVIKNAGHTLNLEHVTEVCAVMRKFLQEIEK